MKKTIVVILLLLLTSVWSVVFVGASTVQHLGVLPPSNKTLCSPTVLPIGGYNLVLEADTTTTFMLEYFNLQQCFPMQMAITLLQPSQPTIIRDTICAGDTYTWNGNTYSRPGTYTDTLQNIHGCDSIVTLHLEVLPDPPLTFTVNGVSFKMMRVRAGTFMMGATDDDTEAEAHEKPAHQVILTRDYFIGETMLTQELWTAVMGTTIQEEEEKSSGDKGLGYGANFPMYCISYYDCLNFVERLNQLTGLTFRMPTEAEWEYAARGGHLSKGYKYPGSNDANEVAWNSSKDPENKLHVVKLLLPNELGLYDMAGNTWEWVYDYNRPYTEQSQIDPIGDTLSINAFIRGGSSYYRANHNRVSDRGISFSKAYKRNRIAFRFVLDADRVIGEDNTTYQAFDTICAGETYTWNGNTYTKPGSYTDTLQNIHGCDSIVTLHLHVNPTYEIHDTIVACDSYLYNPFSKNGGGVTLYESGTYKDTITSISGCDSVFVLHLTINQSEIGTTEYATICHGETYTWNGNVYDTSDTYTLTLSNQQGCDSTATLVLTVLPKSVTQTENAIIGSDKLPYLWRRQSLNATGQYTDTLYYATAHCDSVIHVLNLTVLATGATDEQTATICDTELPYQWYNQAYTATGQYTYTEKYAGTNIDSIQHILNLTINYRDTAFFAETACDSYEWHGKEYNESGTYYYYTQTMLGCDSVEVIRLTILPPTKYLSFDTLLCHGVTCEWRNKQYTTAGTYNDTVRNILLCDSIIYTLNLQYLPDVVYVEEDTLLCHGVTCEWRNKRYTTAGTYNDTVRNMLLCDSIIYTLNLQYLPNVVYVEEDTLLCHGVTCEWRNKQYTTAGSYNDTVRNMLLCDSIIYTLNLQYLPDVVYVEEDTLLCHGVTCEWRKKQYTTAGTYSDTVKNQLQCDSIIYTIELSYLPEVQHFVTDTAICYGFACTWRDYTYAVSGTYHDTIRNTLHCDSIIYTLNLLIHPEIPITHVTDTMAGPEYHWNEQIYTTGGEYSVILPAVTGCDSTVVLHLQSNPAAIDTVILYEQCAGSGEQEIEILTQGFISQIAFRYSPKALAAGWQDTIMPFSSNDLYTLSYRDMRAGIYEATAVGLFHDVEVATYSFTLTYLYPTTIFEQRYNDLITVLTHDYNGGYDFVAFQWYKDGVLIPGATHSYLNQSLGFEAEYSVLLTDTNGLALMSCPIIAEDKAELSVYPTILQPGGSAKVSITESNVLYIHDSTGKIIQEHHLEQGITDISMPIVSGVYLLRFVSNDHIERTFKLIVQ